MPEGEIYEPVGYSALWAVLGAGAILLAVAGVIVILALTRKRRPAPEAPAVPLAPGDDPFRALRAEHLALIGDIDRRYREGALDERAVHLALSAQMRAFASARLGINASAMTLSEIVNLRHADPLSSLIARNYRPSFSDDTEEHSDPAGSIQLATTAVQQW